MTAHSLTTDHSPYPRKCWNGTLHLIRHGHSLGNALRETYHPGKVGNARVPMTLLGHQQAAETGQRLAEQLATSPDAQACSVEIFCSGYLRAMQTAEHLWLALQQAAVRFAPAITAIQSLGEVDVGLFTGGAGRDAEGGTLYASYVEEKRANAFRARPPAGEFQNRHGQIERVPGESIADVHERAAFVVNRLAQQLGKRLGNEDLPTDIVIVSHGFVQQTLQMALSHGRLDEHWYNHGTEPANGECWEADITLYETAPGQFILQAGEHRVAYRPAQQRDGSVAAAPSCSPCFRFHHDPQLEQPERKSLYGATLRNLLNLAAVETVNHVNAQGR